MNKYTILNEYDKHEAFYTAHGDFYNYILSQVERPYEFYYIFSPVDYYDDMDKICNPESVIPTEVIRLAETGSCLIILDLMFEGYGFITDEDNPFQRGFLDNRDAYTALVEFSKKHRILDNCICLTMIENAKEFADNQLIPIVSISNTSIARSTKDDDISKLDIVDQPKTLLWLNRRMRPHRVTSVAMAIENDVDLNDAHFSLIGDKYEVYETASNGNLNAIDWNVYLQDKDDLKNKVYELVGTEVGLDKVGDTPFEKDKFLATPTFDKIKEEQQYRSSSVVEVVSEFQCGDNSIGFTDKIITPIIAKKPFVVIGDKNLLGTLQGYGFKTFDFLWDESYDKLNSFDRLTAITHILKNMKTALEGKYHVSENNQIVYDKEIEEVLKFNRQHYFNVYAPRKISEMKKALSIKTKKILVIAHSRTGSTPYGEVLSAKNNIPNLDECMNFDDMIIPRSKTDFSIRFDLCSEEFLEAIDKKDYNLICELLPEIDDDAFYFKWTEDFHWITSTSNHSWIPEENKLTEDKILEFYKIRAESIKNLDTGWIIQVMNYHAIPTDILNELLDAADEVKVLKRKDRIQHTISHIVARTLNQWHNIDKEIDTFNYDDVQGTYMWIQECESWQDAVVSNHIDKVEKVYYEDIDFSLAHTKKNKEQPLVDIAKCKELVGMASFTNSFKKFLKDKSNTEVVKRMIKTHTYLKEHFNKMGYWQPHLAMLNSIGIDDKDKDIDILDIGTSFGLLTAGLVDYGFINVDCTDRQIEGGFAKMKNDMRVELGCPIPTELDIKPNQTFELEKQYDLIIISYSNFHWKVNEIAHYYNNEIIGGWHVTDKENKSHAFFSPYNLSELQFFVESIKSHLKPNGVAVVNPHPYVYNTPGFEQEKEFLDSLNDKSYITIRGDNENGLLDYFVIRKEQL